MWEGPLGPGDWDTFLPHDPADDARQGVRIERVGRDTDLGRLPGAGHKAADERGQSAGPEDEERAVGVLHPGTEEGGGQPQLPKLKP